jgi:Proteasome subunit A N-terminal signature
MHTMMPSKWPFLLALVVFSSINLASSSSADYRPYYYDRNIHFTPDGRLLQVEYAANAADNSSPLVVCQLDENTMVVMTCSRAISSSSSGASARGQRPQDRLVVLEDTVVVGMSGVLSDSLAVLKSSLQDWEKFKLIYGDQDRDAMMLTKVADAIGQACHENCFQGGTRPYGSTMLLMGIDIPAAVKEDNETSDDRDESDVVGKAADSPQYPFRIIQTDPSGAVIPVPVFRVDKRHKSSERKHPKSSTLDVLKIIGGGPDLRIRIEKAIQKLGGEDQQPPDIWDRMRSLAAILAEAQQEQSNPSTPSFFGRKKRKRKGDDHDKVVQLYKLEAVLLSRKYGIHRLSEEQAELLLQQVESA